MINTKADQADSTREQLLDAAEALFLEEASVDVSLRAIGRRAGQRNQSALQYHFGSRDGLVAGILARRLDQLEGRRSRIVTEFLQRNANPDIRECCALLIRAPFLLCREERGFRDLLGLFGGELLAADRQLLMLERGQDPRSLNQLETKMHEQLKHLPAEVLLLRTENAHGLVLLAISRRARRRGSFRGPRAELFFNSLVDQIAAMMTAPVSSETTRALDALSNE